MVFHNLISTCNLSFCSIGSRGVILRQAEQAILGERLAIWKLNSAFHNQVVSESSRQSVPVLQINRFADRPYKRF
jgi:hemolysin-activating ACP:hemolysin acyltransferase